MKTVEEYFDHIRSLMGRLSHVQFERYAEVLLSETRGNLRIRMRFADMSLLEISEAFVLTDEKLHWLSYRYHYQDASAVLVFRYDNAPHHPEISTQPDHKHSRSLILPSLRPALDRVLEEIRTLRDSS